MSSVNPSAQGHEHRNQACRRLPERFERQAQMERERREEAARNTTRQRVEDANSILRKNPFPDPELESNGGPSEVRTATPSSSSRRPVIPPPGPVKLPAYHEYSTLNGGREPSSSNVEDENFVIGDRDRVPNENSVSFCPAVSSPLSSPQSDTNIDTSRGTAPESQSSPAAEEDVELDVDPSVMTDPQVQALVQELHEVRHDQQLLQKDLDAAKSEIDNLRKQVDEAEERAVQEIADPTKTAEFINLRSILRECQAHRKELERQLEEAEERERELRRLLEQARRELQENENEMNAAKSERDMSAQMVADLQRQLDDARQRQDMHAEAFTRLISELDRKDQDRERYERLIAQLQEDRERLLEQTRISRRGRRGIEYKVDDMSFAQQGSAEAISRRRTSIEVEKRGGQLRKVRRST